MNEDFLSTDGVLCDELKQYLQKLPGVGQCLRHPFVYQVPYFGMADMANYMLETKNRMYADAIAEHKFMTAIMCYERPYRLNGFVDLMDDMSDQEYWENLSFIWTDTENAWENIDQWKDLFNQEIPNKHYIMSSKELDFLKKLPYELTIYRGCSYYNEFGISWTLDFDKAVWFATRFEKKQDQQLVRSVGPDHDRIWIYGNDRKVISKQITKDQISAVFLERGEQEVILT